MTISQHGVERHGTSVTDATRSNWNGQILKKHAVTATFIPLEDMNPDNIPEWNMVDKSDISFSEKDVVGYFEVVFDRHLENIGTDNHPKYHGGKDVYYYPADDKMRRDFEIDTLDLTEFYAW